MKNLDLVWTLKYFPDYCKSWEETFLLLPYLWKSSYCCHESCTTSYWFWLAIKKKKTIELQRQEGDCKFRPVKDPTRTNKKRSVFDPWYTFYKCLNYSSSLMFLIHNFLGIHLHVIFLQYIVFCIVIGCGALSINLLCDLSTIILQSQHKSYITSRSSGFTL